ncbi:MAG TPA: decaprenyl-phosphate phosphoribosyltransferase [Acidimicrobiales bacterium]|nr:decaprenyl-phosphate phosphoribosyltransferase [Acidimicrobiales bacterium]
MTTNAMKERGPLRALASAMRPRQWVKNGLIVVAPAAAGTLFHHDVARQTAVAFLAFCSVASGLYLLNDLRDVEADREHPTKRYRAIASGQLSAAVATSTAVVLLLVGFLLPLAISRPQNLYLVLGLYVVISLSYIFWLKTLAIIELGAVASGYFLRAYAGAASSHIFVSTWFLVVISFGALFLVVGKRDSELKAVGAGGTRKVLAEYTSNFLDSALTLCATVVVTGYCLWAFDTSNAGLSSNHDAVLPIRLSVVPVVFAVLFILRYVEAGQGAAPEDLVIQNRTVQVLMVVWATLMVFGVYG